MIGRSEKTTFAVFLGNRGVFPGSLMRLAREELTNVLRNLGHNVLLLDAAATRHGAVSTLAEAEVYAEFLKENEGKFGGVILSLPNFGDESSAIEALRNIDVPILIQAYPDEIDKMSPELRRDAFCGKLSIMNLFYQNDMPFTALKPHTVVPSSEVFTEQVDYFDRVCRVVNSMKKMRVGAIGARTSPFKTVRIDETALQRDGITVETFDLSDIFARMDKISNSDGDYMRKADTLISYADFSGVPAGAVDKITKLAVVIDNIISEYWLDAVAVRCWLEMQQILGISPCVVMSELNNRFIPASCEVDVGNAVVMYALSKASGEVAACLDWNNNYGDDENKCILFHCGPVPQSMMAGRGIVEEHAILSTDVGKGCSYGCNVGRIKPGPFTFSSMTTDNGELKFYIGEGEFTSDSIPSDFFGCAGVAEIDELQEVLLRIAREGHRHHVSVTPARVASSVIEALEYYLGFEVNVPQEDI